MWAQVFNAFTLKSLRQLFLFTLLTGLLSFSLAPAIEATTARPVLTEWVATGKLHQNAPSCTQPSLSADQETYFGNSSLSSNLNRWVSYDTQLAVRFSTLNQRFLYHRAMPLLQTRNNAGADGTEARLLIL